MYFLSREYESMMLFKMSGTNHQLMWHYIAEDTDIHCTDVKAKNKNLHVTLYWIVSPGS